MGSLRIVRTALRSVGGEEGFTLVESMMAAVLLVVVGTSLSGVLASSVAQYSASRERTIAEQLTQDQIEAIRRMPFSSVGLQNGNPSGPLSASRNLAVTGLHATMKLQISYVDDQTPNSYRTYANYKKVVVTVNRKSDSKQLVKEVTYVSAAAKNAATEAVITALVMDYGSGGALDGATVNLATGPSAPRTDTTDASGKAIFPALTANPLTGGQAYYDLNVTPPFGYVMLKDDLPPSGVAHKQLGVSEPWPTTLRAYRPCTLNVSVPAPPTRGTPAVGVPYTLSVGSARASEAFARTAGTTIAGPITSVAGEPLVPMPTPYTVGASAVYGSGSSAQYWFATPVSGAVPVDYVHNNLTQSFTFAGNGNWYSATAVSALTIKVQNVGGTLQGGARVAISGGPAAAPIYVAGTTATSGGSLGMVTVMVPTSSSGYTLTAWMPTTAASLTGQLTNQSGTGTKTITVQ